MHSMLPPQHDSLYILLKNKWIVETKVCTIGNMMGLLGERENNLEMRLLCHMEASGKWYNGFVSPPIGAHLPAWATPDRKCQFCFRTSALKDNHNYATANVRFHLNITICNIVNAIVDIIK